jgi:hypothetical protein
MPKVKSSWIRQFTLATDSWTPIITPMAANYFLIIGNQDGSAMERCSDTDDALTSYEIPAGGWFSLLAPVNPGTSNSRARYAAGEVVTYLKAKTGTGPAIVEFYA